MITFLDLVKAFDSLSHEYLKKVIIARAPKPLANLLISFYSDIFPLGLIFAYTLNDGKHPFGDDIGFAEYNIKKKNPMIATVEQLDKEFPGAFELIKSMLNPDPKARPKARALLDKSFFTDRDLEFYK